MVTILEKIPEKRAKMVRVPKEKPTITGFPGSEYISYKDLSIPVALNRRFLQKCNIDIKVSDNTLTNEEVEERVCEVNKEKDLYLRFAGKRPLSVVTEKFKEISPQMIVDEASRLIGAEPVIRYFANNESLQLNFPIQTVFNGMHLVINTGNYGVYGGSGLNAIKYGIAWYNRTCSNWTMFLDKVLQKGFGRIVHMGNGNVEEKMAQIMTVTTDLEGKINESRNKPFTYPELDTYLNQYERRGLNKKIAEQVRKENPFGLSAYDLSYRLTELCQDDKLSDVTRARIEYLAGEVILCYDDIKKKLASEKGEPKRIKRTYMHPPHMSRGYVLLN